MNRRALWLAVVSVALASSAQAGVHNMSGCGLGSMLFKNNVKGEQILASTTNGSFGNQTFGISSETLGCTADGVVKREAEVEVYAAANFSKLSAEMARGGGETLAGLGSLLGVRDQKSFFSLAQSRYERIFPTVDVNSTQMLANLRWELALR